MKCRRTRIAEEIPLRTVEQTVIEDLPDCTIITVPDFIPDADCQNCIGTMDLDTSTFVFSMRGKPANLVKLAMAYGARLMLESLDKPK